MTRLPLFCLTPEMLVLLSKSANAEQLPRIARLYNVLEAVEGFNTGSIDQSGLTDRLDVAFTGSDDDNVTDMFAPAGS